MTPKEKAEEFLDLYEFIVLDKLYAKQSAITCCNEIIEALSFHSWQNRNQIEYWEQVKHEIQKL